MNLIKRSLLGMSVGLTLAFSFGVAYAQTADIPAELVSLAKDLGCQSKAECAEKFNTNIEQGITLAQKYDIYTPEQEKVAGAFKAEVLERLRGVSQNNFEQEILALANKILKDKPALAKTMGVTQQGVDAAQTITNTIKDAGVDIRTCQKSPENLSREELIACVKAGNNLSGKGTSVGDYIPKENIKAGEVQKMLDLENSLLAGEYPGLGKIGVEEAGQICLKPDSESITDCDKIATRFFGAEGVQDLQRARQQTTQIKEYYTKGIEKMELVTPDGQKIIGKGAIKNACDSAFEDNNLGLARACGNFAVKNGFATQAEIENGLKVLETFSQKGQGVNFDDCRFNPESCKEFLPDEFRGEFDSQSKIFQIMSESIGFDPSRCENTFDPEIGKRCMEGARKALSQVEEIAKNSPSAQRIVNEIRSHVTEGERMAGKRDEFHQQDLRSGGMTGPGGCKGPEECFKYCNQPTNSAECIAFGAKSQIFEQDTVVQRFNVVNEKFTPQGQPYPYPLQNDDNNFPNTFSNQPGQPNQSNQRDPGFNQYPQYPYRPQQPAGPSPECFAAISSGDFVKAKAVCSSTTENYPKPIAEPFPVCPAYSIPSPCPEGQMRQQASDAKGCMSYGACIAIENYKPIDISPKACLPSQYWDGRTCVANPEQNTRNVCPMMATVDSCPSGQEKYETYSSPGCGIYYGCRTTTTDRVSTVGSCDYSTQYWKAGTSQCLPRTNCSDTANSEYNSSECQGVRGMTQPVSYGCGSFTTQTMCQASPGCGWANGACGGNTLTNTACTTGQYWNGTACINSSTTTGQCPSGQYWFIPPAGGMGYCMSNTISSGSCPTGYHSHGESGGFCMNDQENYSGICYNSAGTATMACPQTTYTGSCTSGQYWNGSSCVNSSTTTGQCPSGQYWYTPSNGGTGYCMSSSSTTCPSEQYWNGTTCVANSTGSGCVSGQYWNGTTCVANSTTSSSDMSTQCAQAGGTWNSSSSYCQMPTTTMSCPSGQHWYTPSSGTGYCISDTTGSGSATTCSSGQYWDGSACVTSTTSSSSDMSAQCAQAGGSWNGSTCVMPTTTTTTSTTCSSGQYWDGSACVTSTTSSSSDMSTMCAQGGGTWDGSTCIMPSSPSAMVLCGQSGGNWTGAACDLAQNISNQKAYYNYYQKQSGSELAQAIRAFVDLFR